MVLDQVQPSHEWHVTNSRQQQLYVVCYTPASPKALLVFHHGLQEHSRRYDKGKPKSLDSIGSVSTFTVPKSSDYAFQQ